MYPANDDMTSVTLQLETGRTHQIRVHMSYLGHPLCGDTLYGGTRQEIGRQALHSEHLSFIGARDNSYEHEFDGFVQSQAAMPPRSCRHLHM